jgi:hypothetical protein
MHTCIVDLHGHPGVDRWMPEPYSFVAEIELLLQGEARRSRVWAKATLVRLFAWQFVRYGQGVVDSAFSALPTSLGTVNHAAGAVVSRVVGD